MNRSYIDSSPQIGLLDSPKLNTLATNLTSNWGTIREKVIFHKIDYKSKMAKYRMMGFDLSES